MKKCRLSSFFIIQIFVASTVLLSACNNSPAVSKSETTSAIDTLPSTPAKENKNDLSGFIPEGYVVLDSVRGHLNGDAYLDMLLLLTVNESADSFEWAKRPLLILTGDEEGKLQLAAKNDKVVYSGDSGGMLGDPYQEISIEKGCFTVFHYGGSRWRWEVETTFCYSDTAKNWYLEKDYHHGYYLYVDEDEEKKEDDDNVITKTTKDFGVIAFDKYDIYAD
jgi:hypothetical protein